MSDTTGAGVPAGHDADAGANGPHPAAPAQVAAAVAALPAPLLVVCDLDGTLSPIAPHADLAELAPGARAALAALAAAGVAVAAVTGRSLSDARARFALPATVRLIASHGLEDDGAPLFLSDADEERRVGLLALAREAEVRAPGAWAEEKPAGVVLHVRQADPELGTAALEWFERQLPYGTWVLHAKAALEASVLKPSKASAVAQLRDDLAASAVLALGDDLTDEELFASLRPDDVTVRVGPGESVARYRLEGPEQVVELLGRLAALLPSLR